MRVLVLNGPNLGRLGRRQPELYGTTTHQKLAELCRGWGRELGLDVEVRQTNHEGEMLEWLGEAADLHFPVVLNAAAWSHYSYAVADACAALERPLVEVHITDPRARPEEWRHHSVVTPYAVDVVAGMGVEGYRTALEKLRAAVGDVRPVVASAPDGMLSDEELLERQRTIWSLGDQARVHATLLRDLPALLVEACGVGAGDLVLDVGVGAGPLAILAAQAGAEAAAVDLVPELLEAARARAADVDARIDWQEADASALPYPDDTFDDVLSAFGAMFSPHHERAADELVRVCRPGGLIGLLSWTPEGFMGELEEVLAPFAPPNPPGAAPAVLWGDEQHVRAVLGDRVEIAASERRTLTVDAFVRPEAFRDFFRENYGPVVAVYRRIAGDPAQVAAVDQALVELARRHDVGTAGTSMEWEYLVTVATVKPTPAEGA